MRKKRRGPSAGLNPSALAVGLVFGVAIVASLQLMPAHRASNAPVIYTRSIDGTASRNGKPNAQEMGNLRGKGGELNRKQQRARKKTKTGETAEIVALRRSRSKEDLRRESRYRWWGQDEQNGELGLAHQKSPRDNPKWRKAHRHAGWR